MTRFPSILIPATLALSIAACGGSSGPPGTLSEALIDSMQRFCQKAFDCQSSYDPSMHNNTTFNNYVGGSDVNGCLNTSKTVTLAFNGQDYFTKLDASVTAGRIKYNANDYETCIEAAEAQSCDSVFKQNGMSFMGPAACMTFEVGQVATGNTCTLSEDCATAGNTCDSTSMKCM